MAVGQSRRPAGINHAFTVIIYAVAKDVGLDPAPGEILESQVRQRYLQFQYPMIRLDAGSALHFAVPGLGCKRFTDHIPAVPEGIDGIDHELIIHPVGQRIGVDEDFHRLVFIYHRPDPLVAPSCQRSHAGQIGLIIPEREV